MDTLYSSEWVRLLISIYSTSDDRHSPWYLTGALTPAVTQLFSNSPFSCSHSGNHIPSTREVLETDRNGDHCRYRRNTRDYPGLWWSEPQLENTIRYVSTVDYTFFLIPHAGSWNQSRPQSCLAAWHQSLPQVPQQESQETKPCWISIPLCCWISRTTISSRLWLAPKFHLSHCSITYVMLDLDIRLSCPPPQKRCRTVGGTRQLKCATLTIRLRPPPPPSSSSSATAVASTMGSQQGDECQLDDILSDSGQGQKWYSYPYILINIDLQVLSPPLNPVIPTGTLYSLRPTNKMFSGAGARNPSSQGIPSTPPMKTHAHLPPNRPHSLHLHPLLSTLSWVLMDPVWTCPSYQLVMMRQMS